VLKDNEIYRIGDVIDFDNRNKGVFDELKNNDQYNGTLLKNYILNTKINRNMKLLYNLTKKKAQELNIELYDDNYLVVHIRTGDDLNKRGLNNSKNFNFYVNNINEKGAGKTIIIVTAMHYGNKADSKIYKCQKWVYDPINLVTNIKLLRNLISKIKHKVIIVSNEDVDLDIINLSLAKNLLICPDSGKFSKLVKHLNDIHLDIKISIKIKNNKNVKYNLKYILNNNYAIIDKYYNIFNVLNNENRSHPDIIKLISDNKYQNTILNAYVNKCNKKNNYKILYDIFLNKSKNIKLYNKNDTTLLICLGDDNSKNISDTEIYRYYSDILFNKKDKTKIVNIIILIQYDSKNNIKKNILNDFKQLHYLVFLCGSEINLVFVKDFDTEITKLIFSNNLIICDDSYDILKPIKKVNERYLMKKLLNKKK
tara:strand:- start:1603 stop:2874 length:1272 start_codon:yes stop_codon:yes gene_type:complete